MDQYICVRFIVSENLYEFDSELSKEFRDKIFSDSFDDWVELKNNSNESNVVRENALIQNIEGKRKRFYVCIFEQSDPK